MRGEAFLGAVTIETTNRVYRFDDGVFEGRATKTGPGAAMPWEAPPAMRGVELIGFLANEGGLWSLSTRWRPGAMAVLTTSAHAYTLTSPTTAFSVQPRAEAGKARPLPAGALRSPSTRPPPAPPSLTRVHSVTES